MTATDTRTVTHSTFTIERRYPQKPERVFAAFADPAKKRRWYAADSPGRTLESFEMDFRVGGWERTVSRFKPGSPFPGVALSAETNYRDIVPNTRIVTAYTMTIGDHRMSSSQATFEFHPDGEGTRLVFTDQGAYFEGSDGPEMRQGGWSSLIDQMGATLAD
jgi:uncharacterized protein YndB with AHSA1/START domain